MGMWFVNEIITHLEEPTGEHYYETCIGIHLSDITEQVNIFYIYIVAIISYVLYFKVHYFNIYNYNIILL